MIALGCEGGPFLKREVSSALLLRFARDYPVRRVMVSFSLTKAWTHGLLPHGRRSPISLE